MYGECTKKKVAFTGNKWYAIMLFVSFVCLVHWFNWWLCSMTCLMHLYEPPALVNGCAHSAKTKVSRRSFWSTWTDALAAPHGLKLLSCPLCCFALNLPTSDVCLTAFGLSNRATLNDGIVSKASLVPNWPLVASPWLDIVFLLSTLDWNWMNCDVKNGWYAGNHGVFKRI